MNLNDIKHMAVERIWLVPMAEDGQLHYVWCDDPAPGAGMNPADAVEYVRKDVHEARVAELEQERQTLKALNTTQHQKLCDEYWSARNALSARDHAAAECEELQQERDELAVHVERLRKQIFICHHRATYSVGDADALALQMAKIRTAAYEALKESPSTNLARRDLIKQAELLERLASGPAQAWDYIEMTGLATDLRQQAKELDDD